MNRVARFAAAAVAMASFSLLSSGGPAGAATTRCSLLTKALVRSTLGFTISPKVLITKESLVTTCSVTGAKSNGLTLSFSSPVPTNYAKTLATSSALDGGRATALKGIGSGAYWDVIPSGGAKSHELLFQKGATEVTIISSATEKKQVTFADRLAALL